MVRSSAVNHVHRSIGLSYTTRRAVYAALLAALLIAGPRQTAAVAQSSSDPLVLAFYYTWFDQNTWSYDQLSDLPAEPYTSSDRSVMGRHIEQAQRAGIDALLVAWYGPGGGNQTEPNLTALLDEAAARGFKIGVLFETTSPFLDGTGDVTAALQHLQSVHAAHPAYLRVDGRPVVFFWRPTIYSVDTWQAIRSQTDPDHSRLWISEGVDTSYLAVFDGHHLYSNTWNPPADLNATNQKFASRVEQARQSFGVYKFWVATVMPGYNDVRIRGAGGFARDREGGNYYAQAWQAAIAGAPNWIVINSFNEWPEGSYIEPSAAFGDQFLTLTAGYSRQFKDGGGVQVQAASLPAVVPDAPPAPTATPTPPPTVPTAYVQTALLNLRSGPGTDFDIVTQVAAGAALPITGSHPNWPDWWQVAYAETGGWVYGPLIVTGGPMEQVPRIADSALPGPVNTSAEPESVDVQATDAAAADLSAAVSNIGSVPLPNPAIEPLRPTLSR